MLVHVFFIFAIWHFAILHSNMNAFMGVKQQFLDITERLKSLDPPVHVQSKPVQRRSLWHIAYMEVYYL